MSRRESFVRESAGGGNGAAAPTGRGRLTSAGQEQFGARWLAGTLSFSTSTTMSLLRAATAQPRRALAAAVPRRLASTHAAEAHHDPHHHPEDTTVYPKESARSPAPLLPPADADTPQLS